MGKSRELFEDTRNQEIEDEGYDYSYYLIYLENIEIEQD